MPTNARVMSYPRAHADSSESPSRESTPPLARCCVPAVRIVEDGRGTSEPALPPPRPSSRESVKVRASLEEALASLEERYIRQLQRRSEPTPAVARTMSYPWVRAGSRESAATGSYSPASRESTPPCSRESATPLDPQGRASSDKPPNEVPRGTSII